MLSVQICNNATMRFQVFNDVKQSCSGPKDSKPMRDCQKWLETNDKCDWIVANEVKLVRETNANVVYIRDEGCSDLQ